MLNNTNSEITTLKKLLNESGITVPPNAGDKDAQIADLQNQIELLNGTVAQKDAEIDSLQNQTATLESQVNDLKAPKLIPVNLRADDTRYAQSAFVEVYGSVANVGTNVANNAKIHVVLYHVVLYITGEIVAKDTYIELGSISGESSVNLDTNINYEGTPITNKTITLEWTP
jgi:hypothetical protein